ncbi:MAG: L-2-hydroxyglutarate oxidase [Gammaproteobacteria bacterium]
MLDYLVIGGGIVGLATARRLRQAEPLARIALLEKEDAVGRHQSGHNSGVIHAGVYYEPGSLKARLCRRGVAATLDFCREHDVPARRVGKLIVATDTTEVGRLDALAARAAANGLETTRLDGAGIAAREPNVSGVAALHVAETGIADYPALCRRLAELLAATDVEIALGAAASAIHERADAVTVETGGRSFTTRRLVVCGGLQADRLARLAGLELDCAVVPFRGDYYRLPPARSGLVSTLIYPVPDPRLPFLGVHLTVTTDGGITIGPTAMLALARERYAKWAFDPADAAAVVRFAGAWRLLARYHRAGLQELLHAASRRHYLRAARRYCPALELTDLADHDCGVRAQVVDRRGNLVHDFLLERTPRSVHVLNAPSPAATAAFPIADTLAAEVSATAAAA